MVKVENLSSSEVVLKFKGKTGGTYQKRLKASSVLKVPDEEYTQLITPGPEIMQTIKISKYNIFGETKLIEIDNPTSTRISIMFVRSETDSYQKILQPKAMLKLKPEEFAFIKNIDPRLQITNGAEAEKLYFMPKQAIIKEALVDIVPVVETVVEPEPLPETALEPIQDRLVDDVKRYKKDKR
jgi:hypothetical protein